MIAVDIACNDHRNGLFNGCAEALKIGDIEMEYRGSRPPTLAELDGAIRLAGKVWPICASKEWLGNWCWNRYVLAVEIPGPHYAAKSPLWSMVDFVKWLRRRDLFSISTATADFDLWWRGQVECRDAKLSRILAEAWE